MGPFDMFAGVGPDVLARRPVRNGREMRHAVANLAEHLHAEIAFRGAQLLDAFLVQVARVGVRDRLAGAPLPDAGDARAVVVGLPGARRLRRLDLERFAVLHAAADELRPVGHRRQRIGFFRQQAPEGRVVPAQLVAVAVAVLADPIAQLFHVRDQLLARHAQQIFVHGRATERARRARSRCRHRRRPAVHRACRSPRRPAARRLRLHCSGTRRGPRRACPKACRRGTG